MKPVDSARPAHVHERAIIVRRVEMGRLLAAAVCAACLAWFAPASAAAILIGQGVTDANDYLSLQVPTDNLPSGSRFKLTLTVEGGSIVQGRTDRVLTVEHYQFIPFGFYSLDYTFDVSAGCFDVVGGAQSCDDGIFWDDRQLLFVEATASKVVVRAERPLDISLPPDFVYGEDDIDGLRGDSFTSLEYFVAGDGPVA
jgi:hypothetical protein